MPATDSIPTVLRAARAATTADMRRRFATAGGYTLAGAMAASAVGVGVLRLLTEAPWWWAVPAGAAAAGLLAAAAAVWARRWPLDHAAGEIDRANSTEGALRTALEIEDRDGEASLVLLARRRGERVAAAVDPKRGIAPSDHRGWWWAIPAAGACVAFGLLLDPIDRTRARPDPSPMIARALDETEPALQDARTIEPDTLPDPDKWAESMAEIEALEEELRRGEGAEDAPTRAAAAMQEAADELERQSELAAREEQTIRDRAEAYRARETDEPSRLAQRLADALARNDMDAAEQAARELDRANETMSEEELRALADTLEDMASRLDDPAEMPREPSARPPGDPGETPAESGEPGQSPPDPGGTPPEPTPTGEPPATTPAPSPEQPPQDRPDPDSVPRALRRQAESLREPSQNPEQREPSRPDSDPKDPGRSGPQEPGEQSRDDGVPDQQSGEQPEQQPGQEPGRQSGERPSADPNQPGSDRQPSPEPSQQTQPAQQGEPQQGPQEQSQPQPGQEQPGQEQQGQERQDRQQQSREQGQQEQGQPQPGEPPNQQPGRQGQPQPQPGEQPGNQPQPTGQPGEQPGQQPREMPTPDPSGRPRGTPQPDPNAPPGSIERAVERLREQQDARQRNRQVAESLRDRARGLMDDPAAPPGEGGAGSEDAPLAQDNPFTDDPARYEPVDASGQAPPDPDAGRVVGEWFDPDREDLPPSQRAAAAGEMRRAVRKARDAMDNQQVPRRYRDLVRRVFDRVERRAEEVSPAPAPQGRDVDP